MLRGAATLFAVVFVGTACANEATLTPSSTSTGGTGGVPTTGSSSASSSGAGTSSSSTSASSSSVGGSAAGGAGGAGGVAVGGSGGAGGSGGVGLGTTAWSKRFGAAGIDGMTYPWIDAASGNITLAGFFETSIDFGTGPMTSLGYVDTFIADVDATGNGLGSTSFFATGGLEYVVPWDVERDAQGNTTVVGLFSDQVDFGGGALVSAGAIDLFAARFDASGNHVWSSRFGDSGDQCVGAACALGLHLTASGDVIVVGTLYGSVDFGGGVLTSAGSSDIFLARFTAATGAHQWSKRAGGAGEDLASAGSDPAGRLLVAGWFEGTLSLPNAAPLTSAGGRDAFVVELDGNGDAIWASSFGGAGEDRFNRIDGGPGGQIAVVGYFDQSINLGGGTFTATGTNDGLVARLDATGTHLWSTQLAGSGAAGLISAAFGDNGVLVAAGYFGGTIDFGSGPVTSVDANSDGFVAAWDTNGTRIATRIIPGADFTSAGVTHQSAGDFLLWGLFENTIDVGTGPLISAGSVDLFLASWTP